MGLKQQIAEILIERLELEVAPRITRLETVISAEVLRVSELSAHIRVRTDQGPRYFLVKMSESL